MAKHGRAAQISEEQHPRPHRADDTAEAPTEKFDGAHGDDDTLARSYNKGAMTTEELIEKVKSLSSEEQTSVVQFIDYLERRQAPAPTSILHAAEQFITEHPELLRRLSQ